jgi:hypothetical protein
MSIYIYITDYHLYRLFCACLGEGTFATHRGATRRVLAQRRFSEEAVLAAMAGVLEMSFWIVSTDQNKV